MTQLEFYKSFQFMAELLIAESIFSVRLHARSYYWLRVIGALCACFLFSWLFPIASQNAFYCSFMFLSLFAFTVLAHKFVYKESWINIAFCCVAGYTTQHFSYELYTLITNLLGVNESMGFYSNKDFSPFPNALVGILYFYIYIVAYFVIYILLGRKIRRNENLHLNKPLIVAFVMLIIVVDVILNAVVVYNFSNEENVLYTVIVGIYNILCCIFALFMQFEVSMRRQLENTLDKVKQLWHQEKEQYAVSKENIALINMKCHDLKHQIRQIGLNSSLSSSSVKEIEDMISIYDSTVKTGNATLDIILTEKSLLCNKNGIKLSCIADGKRLDFMEESDIYSLFGNIIDNAIEAVLKLDADKRVIGIHIKTNDSLLSINTHNYYKADLTFVKGLPVTTKDDKEYHGFGMKSISFICEKYDGDLSIKTEGGVFNLNILFSLNSEKE